MRLNSMKQITSALVFVGILNVIPSGLLFHSLSCVIFSCGTPSFLFISFAGVRGHVISFSLAVFHSVCSTQWSKTSGNSWSSTFHIVRKHFPPLIQIKYHLGKTRSESSPCMRHHHRWCVIVWSNRWKLGGLSLSCSRLVSTINWLCRGRETSTFTEWSSRWSYFVGSSGNRWTGSRYLGNDKSQS